MYSNFSLYHCCHHASLCLGYKSPSVPKKHEINTYADHAKSKQLHVMFSILDQRSAPPHQCKDENNTRTEVVNWMVPCKEDPLWPATLTQRALLNPFGPPIVLGDMFLELKIHFDCLGTWTTPLGQIQIYTVLNFYSYMGLGLLHNVARHVHKFVYQTAVQLTRWWELNGSDSRDNYLRNDDKKRSII